MLIAMSVRLQVLLDKEELRRLKELAKREKMTVSDWVRRALRHEMNDRPAAGARRKLDLIRRYARYDFPSGDYDTIAVQIVSGYDSLPFFTDSGSRESRVASGRGRRA
ncbi:MAG: ribbon-helix-helix protein, CopG family [Spirochaetaceae bacterium]|nr:MAG: ribbon-helix-helix protein, CopG family [Spirochaetaceae bacterium]